MAAADDDDVVGARESLRDELMHDYLTARTRIVGRKPHGQDRALPYAVATDAHADRP